MSKGTRDNSLKTVAVATGTVDKKEVSANDIKTFLRQMAEMSAKMLALCAQ
jgi:hypothetical protein